MDNPDFLTVEKLLSPVISNPFTSGQVSGMTNVPLPTLRRYVIDFRSHFSDQARIEDRGRRWSAKDVELVLGIRHMFNDHYTKKQVGESLSGEWQSKAAPRKDISDAAQIVTEARSYRDQTHTLYYQALHRMRSAEDSIGTIEASMFDYDERLIKLGQALKLLEERENPIDWRAVGIAVFCNVAIIAILTFLSR
jgi:DNA-binding transcriptional MerR regulator